MIYIIKQAGLYQNKVNSSLIIPSVTVKWAIANALIDIKYMGILIAK